MKRFIFCLTFLLIFSSGALAVHKPYEENRTFELYIEDATTFVLDCGAGNLTIQGIKGLDRIELTAHIRIDAIKKHQIANYLERDLELSLEQQGNQVVLKSHFHQPKSFLSFFFGNNYAGGVNLVLKVPNNLILNIEDGSGDISISDMENNINLIDGSSNIEIFNCYGNLEIVDGSGEILVTNYTGDVKINDGSDAMYLYSINGNVEIIDGSGAININNVEKNVRIIEAGSGGVTIENVKGEIIR